MRPPGLFRGVSFYFLLCYNFVYVFKGRFF
nr:MAG TPA: hypothetical protein [Caudoviricetes sp.]